MKNRSVLQVLGLALASALPLASPTAFAQAYPDRVVTWVVPFAAGGPTDAMARMIAEKVARQLGKPIVIENTAGAGGTIGSAKVAKAKADGYTMLVGHVGYMAAAPAMYRKLDYDPVRDFEPVLRFPDTPMVLVVPKGGAKDLASFLDRARREPDKVTLGNAGTGSTSHLVAALFANAANVQFTLVPYKGAGPAMNDVLGGQIEGMFDQSNTALPQVKGGRVSALAVTSRQRLPQLPDVPTVHEAAIPGFEAATWYGVYAPKGTPKVVIDRMNAAYSEVMKDPEFTAYMQEQGIQLLPPDQYGAAALGRHTAAEVERWRPLIAKANITLD